MKQREGREVWMARTDVDSGEAAFRVAGAYDATRYFLFDPFFLTSSCFLIPECFFLWPFGWYCSCSVSWLLAVWLWIVGYESLWGVDFYFYLKM
jgi:hypothetical protein